MIPNMESSALIMLVTKKMHAAVLGTVFDFVKGIAILEQHLPYTPSVTTLVQLHCMLL